MSDGLSGPLLGIAPDDTADSMAALLAWTFQHVDHASPWHPEQLASKMAWMFVWPSQPGLYPPSVSGIAPADPGLPEQARTADPMAKESTARKWWARRMPS